MYVSRKTVGRHLDSPRAAMPLELERNRSQDLGHLINRDAPFSDPNSKRGTNSNFRLVQDRNFDPPIDRPARGRVIRADGHGFAHADR